MIFHWTAVFISFGWPTADRPKKKKKIAAFLNLSRLALICEATAALASQKRTWRCSEQEKTYLSQMWGRDSGTCSGCWHLYFCRMRSLRLRFYTILDLPLSDGYQFLSSSVSCIYRDGPQSQDQYGNNVWQNDVTMNAYSWFKFSTSRGESWSHCLLHCTQLYGPIWATVHIIQMNTAAADTLCVCCWNEALFKTVESLWLQLMIDLSENRKTMQLFESCVGSDCLEK